MLHTIYPFASAILRFAVGAWLARYLVAQVDIPARQSYTMAILPEDERAAASGWLSVAPNAASALAPSLAGVALGASFVALPFLAAGALKATCDAGTYLLCRDVRPPQEQPRG